MVYFVYVLKSLKDNKRYVGITNNIKRRLKQHFSGKVFSTKKRLPLLFKYLEKHPDRVSARKKRKIF